MTNINKRIKGYLPDQGKDTGFMGEAELIS